MSSQPDNDSELQAQWIPRIFGRLSRLFTGIFIIYNTNWFISDQYCLLYWIISVLSLFLIKRSINVGLDFKARKPQRQNPNWVSNDDAFHESLPVFATFSLYLWAVILDFAFFGLGEFYLVFYAINAVI
eukprot:310230_1